MYRILAHRPQILRAHEGYFDAVMHRGIVFTMLFQKKIVKTWEEWS